MASSERHLREPVTTLFSAYSRSRQKLKDLAKDAEANAQGGAPAEAARDADAVLLAVQWTRVDDVLAQAGALSGKVLLTCSLPMSKDDSHIIIGLSTSGAEALAVKVPGAHVVSAFSAVPSEVLSRVFDERGKRSSPDLVYCVDDEGAKKTAAHLIRDAGFNPVDLRSLSMSRYVEEGPALAYRFERFSK